MLDEANARLEAAVEQQVELLERFAAQHEQMVALLQDPVAVSFRAESSQVSQPNAAGNGSQPDHVDTHAERFVDRDTEYSRVTHPALFKVVDLLSEDETARRLSVRQLAHRTGVSKSWCAIAKRYVLSEKSVH